MLTLIRSIVFFVVLLLLMATTSQAHAKDATPTISATGAAGYGVNLKSGTSLSPIIIHGINVSAPLPGDWNYNGEVAMTSSFSEFKPGIQVMTGPSKKLGEKTSVGGTAIYGLQPTYDDTSPSTHILGVSIAPIFKASFGTLSLPMGMVHNVNTGDTRLIFSFKASMRLQ